MAARVTLKAINDELARLGYQALVAKGSGYFYFWSGEAVDWLDRTVRVSNVGSLTLEEWVEEFRRLKKLNQEILSPAAAKTPKPKIVKRKK